MGVLLILGSCATVSAPPSEKSASPHLHADSSTKKETAPPRLSQAELETELLEAIEKEKIDGIRQWLKGCTSTESRRKKAYVAALRSVLFETDPADTTEAMRLLEEAGMDPNIADEQGWPLLSSAVNHDRIDVARWLLENGADVNARSRRGNTALHALAGPMDNPTEDHIRWLELLTGYGAELDAQNENGMTPLCYAALSDRQHELLVALIEKGADFNLGDNAGNTPLSHASQHGQKKNTAYLRSRGARLYSYEFPTGNNAAPCRAVLTGDLTAIRSLPEEDFTNMEARTLLLVPATALHLAAEQGTVQVVNALCAKEVDWNVSDRYGRSPLQLAVMEGRREVVSLLLDHGADPNYSPEGEATPFVVACAIQPEIALTMIAQGFSPEGNAALRAAIGSENLELVKTVAPAVDWGYSEMAFASDIGRMDSTEYLSTLPNAPSEYSSELLQEARENRNRLQEYLPRAEHPLPAPRRDGGIAEKRGTFTYVLESWSPWKQHASVNLADYPVGIYVPDHYDGSEPFGLVVSMTNAKSSSRYPRHFEDTLNRHNLIWVGFDPYNGLHRIGGGANAAFCLAAVYNMLGYYNIDQSRIYIGGYSLGGQLTEHIINTHPWIFDGAFFINIGYRAVSTSDPAWYYCKHHVPMAFVEGDYDYNRVWAYNSYNELLCSGYRDVYYAHEPMKGHKLISAESFETIVELLENGR